MAQKPIRLPKQRRAHHALKHGYRSGLEEKVADDLGHKGTRFEFEPVKIEFTEPAKLRRYTPDFILPNGIIIESKGRFKTADRQKHIWLRDEYPKMDLRFVFANPNNRLRKGSPTTYAKWCEKNGFLWAKQRIPVEWINEPGPKWTPFNLEEIFDFTKES